MAYIIHADCRVTYPINGQRMVMICMVSYHRVKFLNKLKLNVLKDDNNFNPTCRTCEMLNLQRMNILRVRVTANLRLRPIYATQSVAYILLYIVTCKLSHSKN